MDDGDLEKTRVSSSLDVWGQTSETKEVVKARSGRKRKVSGHRSEDEGTDSGVAYRTSRQGGQIQRIEEDPGGYLADNGTTYRKRSRRSLRGGSPEDVEGTGGTEGTLPRIEFVAALSYSRDPISINGDGEIKVVLEIPASAMPEAIKLLLYRNKSFQVTIEENER